jgi:hypothetical protein
MTFDYIPTVVLFIVTLLYGILGFQLMDTSSDDKLSLEDEYLEGRNV